jgi:hypothetical protein
LKRQIEKIKAFPTTDKEGLSERALSYFNLCNYSIMRHVVGHREDGDKSVNEHDICVVSRFNVPPPLWSGTMDSPMEEQHPTAIVERLSTRVEAMDDPENRHGCHGRQ